LALIYNFSLAYLRTAKFMMLTVIYNFSLAYLRTAKFMMLTVVYLQIYVVAYEASLFGAFQSYFGE